MLLVGHNGAGKTTLFLQVVLSRLLHSLSTDIVLAEPKMGKPMTERQDAPDYGLAIEIQVKADGMPIPILLLS